MLSVIVVAATAAAAAAFRPLTVPESRFEQDKRAREREREYKKINRYPQQYIQHSKH